MKEVSGSLVDHVLTIKLSGHIDSDITAECIQHDDVEKRYLTAYAVSFYGTGAPDVPAYELRDCDVGPCPV